MNRQRVAICQVNDLSDGQMRQITAEGQQILLARQQGEWFAIAAHCSHYGAPLARGVMHQDHVVCPWHNACFSLRDGSMLEPPGRNHLQRYEVQIDGDTVYVDLSSADGEAEEDGAIASKSQRLGQKLPPLTQPDYQADSRTFVIVGGGAAGNAAAEMLRQQGFQGHIIVLTADSEPPYDRTTLSKAYLQQDNIDDPDVLRTPEFYDTYGIEIKTSAAVTALDADAQQLTYGDGQTLHYDAVLLAPGGKVRQLPIDGMDFNNVFTLRRATDAAQILKSAQSKQQAVVVGAGFIGMEVAASLRQQGLAVTVVASDAVPFESILGKEVGRLFQRVHEENGVQFKLNTKATAFNGESAAGVQSVTLDSGETLPAELVIVGIGVQPNTDFVDETFLDAGDRSIIVNEYLQAAPNLYAAGDSAQFPYFMTGEPTRIEHWRLALQQGRIAAHNMLGKAVPFRSVPFFWTGQFGLKLRYVGHATDWDQVIVHGSLDDQAFLAFYGRGERVLAVAGSGRDRDIAAISELMRLGDMLPVSAIKQGDRDWAETLAQPALATR